MRLTNEICVSFLTGSGWMQNHDKELIQKTRKEVMDAVGWHTNMQLENNSIHDEETMKGNN